MDVAVTAAENPADSAHQQPNANGLTDEQLLQYILCRPQPDELLGQACIGLSDHDMKLLNLAHDWINIYLVHNLRKIDRVTFGLMSVADLHHARERDPLMPRSRAKLAIPFISKDVPAPAS
eukprot:344944-Prymnesium_polylepis.1